LAGGKNLNNWEKGERICEKRPTGWEKDNGYLVKEKKSTLRIFGGKRNNGLGKKKSSTGNFSEAA